MVIGIYICMISMRGKNILYVPGVSNQNWPDVSGNYVVWADDRNGKWDIFMCDIRDKKETSVCTNSADQTHPVISYEKLLALTVMYVDERDGSNIYISMPQHNGWEGYEYQVPLNDHPASSQSMPHMADKQLVYTATFSRNRHNPGY